MMVRSSGNLRMAVEAIRSNRWRSLLTMLGIIIGIVSVVTTVSLGEGAKRTIINQINQAGANVISIRPGQPGKSTGGIGGTSVFSNPHSGTLSENDYNTVSGAGGVKFAVPFSYVTNVVSNDEKSMSNVLVVGTTENLPAVLGQKILYGSFFSDEEPQPNIAIIGQTVAEQLFGENVPIGKLFNIRGKQFLVRGIFDEFDTNPLVPESDYNSAIFIQYDTSKELTGNSDIYQILAQPKNPNQTGQVAGSVTSALKSTRAGQEDFTVLTQEDRLSNANEMLTMMTSFVAGIAAISLIVGGIGILNIMLVSVTERTREIGIRKAIGATNGQILNQFLTEAVILSVLGGVFGILLSLLANYLLRIFTNLSPVITWPIMVVAFLVSVIVGIIFGVTPALTAAKKRPIDALRYE